MHSKSAKICLVACYLISLLIFMGLFIFSTMIAYGVHIKTFVSDHLYDFGVKGQGHIMFMLKKYLLLVTLVSLMTDGVHFHNNCPLCLLQRKVRKMQI